MLTEKKRHAITEKTMKNYANIKMLELYKTIPFSMSLFTDSLWFLVQFKGTNLPKGLKK